MSRQIHETQADLDNEEIVKQAIEKKGVVLHKLPMSYRMDYIVFRSGKAISVVEVKSRTKGTLSTKHPLFMLSLSKWNAGIDYATKGLAFYLAGKFDDGVFLYKYSPNHDVDIRWYEGRKDRQDPDDQEPCVYVPMKLFRKL